MQLFWGDIHNHCGISYGYGSLENALRNASNHLDFCAVTGHAMWSDMFEENEDTEFVIGYCNEGFTKFKSLWEKHVKQLVQKSNTQEFVAFQGYEMHSREFGDHHVISPDDEMPLIYCDAPREFVEKCSCRILTVAHHIGYLPNYRGIDWEKHDENITPLIEVCSKHGCAMSETAPYAYYHTMGPRDGRNTIYEGLRLGKHIGFIGSTDHHAGFPGSYGDGKMAVWAEERSRDSIFEAMLARRVYAVTGDRIQCEFSINGNPMGSIIKDCTKERNISYDIIACYPIDKIVLYKNLKPIDIVEGLLLENNLKDRKFKLRVEMGWGDNSDELYRWDGRISIEGGTCLDVEPCFRGRSVLAPDSLSTDGYDYVNDLDSKIVTVAEQSIVWQCFTLKNPTTLHPQTSAVILEIEGGMDTLLDIEINDKKRRVSIGELIEYGFGEQMEEYSAQAYKVHPIITESNYRVKKNITDFSNEGTKDYYHLEVIQRNGSCAFVSPVYCE